MKALKRLVLIGSLVSALLPFATQAAPAPTPTSAPQPAAISGCKLTPSDFSCTGQDPQLMGCEADAYTLAQAESFGSVRVSVRYSPSCRSAWARVVNLSNQYGTQATAQILRSDGTTYARAVFYPTTAGVSPMVFIGQGRSVKSIGALQNSYGSVLAQIQTGFVRP